MARAIYTAVTLRTAGHRTPRVHDDDYSISTDTLRMDVRAIHAFLERSYWSPRVPLGIVEKAIANSMCFGVFHGDEQVGFARVVTDRATFAYLADVYVLEAHRGRGLSKRLMAAIIGDADLQGLRRFILATSDAHGLYAQFGFREVANPRRWMEIYDPVAYRGEGSAAPSAQ